VAKAPNISYGLFYAFFVRYGKLVSASCPSLGKYSSAILGSHAGPEAMLVYSFSFGRLICTFHRLLFMRLNLFTSFAIVFSAKEAQR
jgi:hypothetical protein